MCLAVGTQMNNIHVLVFELLQPGKQGLGGGHASKVQYEFRAESRTGHRGAQEQVRPVHQGRCQRPMLPGEVRLSRSK